MLRIIPAILQKDFKSFEAELEKVWRVASRVHLDVIDGKFEETVTVGPEVLKQVDTIVRFDVHLMVEQPEDWVERVVASGADRVFGQIEKMNDPAKFIADAQFEGLEVGLAYDIDTPLDDLERYISDLDAVLLMSVKAGAQGRDFDERVLDRIEEVRRLNKRIMIIVDGGLDEERIKECLVSEWEEEIEEEELFKTAETMEFVVGSHLYTADNIEQEFEDLSVLKKHE